MSFSTNTKEELARIIPEKKCCQMAELAALIRMSGTLEFAGLNEMHIQLSTENPSTARKIFKLIKQVYGFSTEIQVRQTPRFNKGKQYVLLIQKTEDSLRLLKETGVLLETEEGITLLDDWPGDLLKSRCCRRAYLRGAFLGGGSISSPEKNYHLEFVSSKEPHIDSIQNILKRFRLEGKRIERKGYHVLYLKEGEQIVDLLNIMGAHQALLALENIRILKQMRNNINRIVNCETANLSKTVQASMRQVEMINFIDRRIGIQHLPQGLRDISVARLKYPESSLKELGELMNPPVGKSGINHRFRKLEEIEKKLKSKKKSDRA
jgi:cell division protein WhiA